MDSRLPPTSSPSHRKTHPLKTPQDAMLTTKRPTQTTVLYTVSTRSPTKTIAGRLANYAFILLRIAIGICVATVLLNEFSNTASYINGWHALAWLENAILTSPTGQLATLLVSNLSFLWRMLICAGITWLILRKGYTEERLLVIRGLGVQTSTSSPSYLWTSSTRFIPTSSIQDIFIHEAFKGFEVRFYLSIVVEGEEDVVVVFPSILPRREILEQVWRGARACLYEPKS